jgi:hypothetical protein
MEEWRERFAAQCAATQGRTEELEDAIARLATSTARDAVISRAGIRGLGDGIRQALDRMEAQIAAVKQACDDDRAAALEGQSKLLEMVRGELGKRSSATQLHEEMYLWVVRELEFLHTRLAEVTSAASHDLKGVLGPSSPLEGQAFAADSDATCQSLEAASPTQSVSPPHPLPFPKKSIADLAAPSEKAGKITKEDLATLAGTTSNPCICHRFREFHTAEEDRSTAVPVPESPMPIGRLDFCDGGCRSGGERQKRGFVWQSSKDRVLLATSPLRCIAKREAKPVTS